MTGSKANQTEIFELPIDAITFGRDTNCKVAYDPLKDDLVSRTHLKITLVEDDQFLLTDLGSSNGTFVNEQKIAKPVILQAGDIVQLGKNGPKFEFDLDPRPPVAAKATRLQEVPIPKSTRESQVSSTVESQLSRTDIQNISTNQKQGVGRETVERLIDRVESDARVKIAETEGRARRKMINVSAGIFTVIVLVAGYFFYQNQQSQKQLQATEEQLKSNIAAAKEEQSRQMEEMKSNTPMSATEISQKYESAVVYIETSWKLKDVESGQQLYHGRVCQKSKSEKRCLPAYVSFQREGKEYVEPLLFTENVRDELFSSFGIETERGVAIGKSNTGSGFVVDMNGFILTNTHVAAAWEVAYDISQLENGFVIRCNDEGKNCKVKGNIADTKYLRLLEKWIPANTQYLGGRPQTGKYVEGYHDYLEVTFPGLGQRSNARLTKISGNADVALIKVDAMKKLVHVELNSGRSISTGEPVTVMGYPIISPDTSVTRQNRKVPEPTITTGIIGKVIENKAGVTLDTVGKNVEMILFKGLNREDFLQKHMIHKEDGSLLVNELLYQLTINAAGAGTSGGPVFDSKGQVIGIFTDLIRDEQGTQVSLALPIKYGLEIMK